MTKQVTEKSAKILSESLALPEHERAELVAELLRSLEPPAESNVEQAWEEEVERRLRTYEAGEMKTVPWEQVRDELWAGLRESS